MTKFFRIFMVVLSLVGLLSLNVGAAVIAESGSTFDQTAFTFNSNLSNFGSFEFYGNTFPGGYVGIASRGPVTETAQTSCVFDLPVRFPSPVSSFSVAVDSSSRAFFLDRNGVWESTTVSEPSLTISILDISGNVVGSSSASFSVPTDSAIVRITGSVSSAATSLPRGIGYLFTVSFPSVSVSDVTFIDYVMNVPSVVLGVVGQVTAAIVEQPFLLMTTGILLLGAGCGILGRVLSRD